MSSIASSIAVAMYSVYHPGYLPTAWQLFVGYFSVTWMACSIVLFANRALPMVNNIGLFFILAGVFVTILVCAITPHINGSGYATSSFVWTNWQNSTGWDSNGFVFLAGMLNGAFAIGTPDCVSHLAEEIPNPKRNVPLAIGAQMVIGFITPFLYMVAIFYAISNLTDVTNATSTSPIAALAEIYAQATSSNGGTIGLLFIIFVPIFCTLIGTYITAGRCLWSLARDNAVPFSCFVGTISPRFMNPFNATAVCGIFITILGAIAIASSTAFNAFVSSFVVLSTLSYLAAILPFIFTRRFSRAAQEPGPYNNSMIPGPYQMGHRAGYFVNIVSCAYIIVFVVIFCFPSALPVSKINMNYSAVIVCGISAFAAFWWLLRGKTYIGPKLLTHEGVSSEAVRTVESTSANVEKQKQVSTQA